MALIGFHVERGYVERAPSPLDQRAYGLRITPKGRRVLAKLKPTIRDLEAKAMARLTPLEQQQLFALLEKIGFPSGSGLAGARASATDTP
jgi:DNA-binding MarR family transcriptional regulator